ncbi:hypothetical protein ACHAPU_001972 [Fusarium lateritium]
MHTPNLKSSLTILRSKRDSQASYTSDRKTQKLSLSKCSATVPRSCCTTIPSSEYLHPVAFYSEEDAGDPKGLEITSGPRIQRLLASPDNGGLLGMHIAYKNGGERFVGISHPMGLTQASAYCKEPAEMNIEVPRGQSEAEGPATLVYFSPSYHKPRPGSRNTQYPMKGELHCWQSLGCVIPELRILPSGSWQTSDIWD